VRDRETAVIDVSHRTFGRIACAGLADRSEIPAQGRQPHRGSAKWNASACAETGQEAIRERPVAPMVQDAKPADPPKETPLDMETELS